MGTKWYTNTRIPGIERECGNTGIGGGRGSSNGTVEGSSRSKSSGYGGSGVSAVERGRYGGGAPPKLK